MQWWQVQEVNEPVASQETPGRVDLIPPLRVWAGMGGALTVRWEYDGAQTRFLVAVDDTLGLADPLRVLFPGSARESVPAPTSIESATLVGRWVASAAEAASFVPTGLEDLASGGEPFIVEIEVSPLAEDEVARHANARSVDLPRLRSVAELDAQSAGKLEQIEAELERIEQGRSDGLWTAKVEVQCSPDAFAAAVAHTVASPAVATGGIALVLNDEIADEPETILGSRAVAELVSPPRVEVPGVRVTSRSRFDVNVEEPGGLVVGRILDDRHRIVGDFGFPLASLNRHTFVTGATGSGKSVTTRRLLVELAGRGVPWMVIEPAKAEYGSLSDVVDLARIRPGAPEQPAYGLEPMRWCDGFPVQTHIDLLRDLFLAAFDAEEPFPQVLSLALTRAYAGAVAASQRAARTLPYPSLSDLRRAALAVVDDVGYGAEVSRNVRGFVDVRLASLFAGSAGRFLEGGHPLDIGALVESNSVIELEDIGSDTDKAFAMGALLLRLYEHFRVRAAQQAPDGLEFVIVIEEAHRLLRSGADPSRPGSRAVETYSQLLAESRAYGVGMVIVDQIPSKISSDVIKNTAIKLVHRLPATDDRELVGGAINLTDPQHRAVVSLKPGHAVSFVDGMDRPVAIAVEPHDTTVSTGGIIEPPLESLRARSCSPARCGGEPCSLQRLGASDKLVADPRIDMWVELTVVALLTGYRPPLLKSSFLRYLLGLDQDRLACGLAARLEQAVRGRAAAIGKDINLADLIGAGGDALAAALRNEEVDVVRSYQSGPFRYQDIRRKLRAKAGTERRSRPHPGTQSWVERGAWVEGADWDQQLASLESMNLARLPWEPVVFGDGPLEALTSDPEFDAMLRGASYLRFDLPWVPLVLQGG